MLANPRLCKWACFGAFALGLVAIGIAMEFSLPPEPRVVLRGMFTVGRLSADGKIVMAVGHLSVPGEGADVEVADFLCTWDAFTGEKRGEFFQRITPRLDDGRHRVMRLQPQRIDGPTPPAQDRFSGGDLYYSPDGRYCALLHERGLALADLQVGREWSDVIGSEELNRRLAREWPADQRAVAALMRDVRVQTKPLNETTRLEDAVKYFTDETESKLSIKIDARAFASPGDPDGTRILDEPITLPPVPTKMVLNTALRLALAQVRKGNVTYLIRSGFVEIMTVERARQESIGEPAFSPRGTFITVMEGRPKRNLLHIVRCASGQLVATLPVHPEGYDLFGFTPDEHFLYYFADADGKPCLTVWDSQAKQVARTFPAVPLLASRIPSSDSRMLLVNSCKAAGGGLDLLDLHSGASRRLLDLKADEMEAVAFGSDGRTLVRATGKQLRVWDLSSGKELVIPLDKLAPGESHVAVDADSRLCILERDGLSSWNIDTGEPVWHRPETYFARDPADIGVWLADPRFLTECSEERECLWHVDPATGKTQATVHLPGFAPHRFHTIKATPDGRNVLIGWQHDPNREPSRVEKWFGDWWPFAKTQYSVIVAEPSTGRVRIRLDFPSSPMPVQLSDDGRTLMTHPPREPGDSDTVISLWDVPGRPSRLRGFGIPAAIGAFGFMAGWARRRIMARTVAVKPTAPA